MPDAPPENIIAVVKSSTSLTVSWSPPPLDKQNGIIISYKVRYQSSVTDLSKEIIVDGALRSCDLDNLEINTRYIMQIAAVTINGSSHFSYTITAKTDEDGKTIIAPN